MNSQDNIFSRDFKPANVEQRRAFHSSDFLPNTIKQQHIESNAYVVFFGLAANRPDGSSLIKAFFATDTGVLSLWDGTSWLTTTLT